MLSCIFRFICISSHPWILITSGSCVLACAFASSHPQTFGSFVLVDICTSLHPHILRLMCACWHPCILTSLYPEVHVCLLASLHPHILIYSASYVFGCILTYSHPYVILPDFYVFFLYPRIPQSSSSGSWVLVGILSSSYPQFHVCFLFILSFSHPHMLRFVCACLYPCFLIYSGPSAHLILYADWYRRISSWPCILISSHPRILSIVYMVVDTLASHTFVPSG